MRVAGGRRRFGGAQIIKCQPVNVVFLFEVKARMLFFSGLNEFCFEMLPSPFPLFFLCLVCFLSFFFPFMLISFLWGEKIAVKKNPKKQDAQRSIAFMIGLVLLFYPEFHEQTLR